MYKLESYGLMKTKLSLEKSSLPPGPEFLEWNNDILCIYFYYMFLIIKPIQSSKKPPDPSEIWIQGKFRKPITKK